MAKTSEMDSKVTKSAARTNNVQNDDFIASLNSRILFIAQFERGGENSLVIKDNWTFAAVL